MEGDATGGTRMGVGAASTATLTKFRDHLAFPPVLPPYAVGEDGTRYYRVEMRPASARFHSELPAVTVWGYEGLYPGPTIEARSGRPVVVEWANGLPCPHPVAEFIGVHPEGQTSQNDPGRGGASTPMPDPPTPVWTVVHLHGGRTPPTGDGWPDDAFFGGQSDTYTYPNRQRAALLWYHDHAMGITRLNVYAGLAGLYVLRDDEEDALGLPAGDYELPLLLQDRNLDTDADGRLTGELLYKLDQENGEFFGPFNLVNGMIWPHLEVEPRQYRLRIVNGSNARFYRLKLRVEDSGESRTDLFRQIGTDGGLLPRPVDVPPEGLLLAPAERADVIVDFRDFAGRNLVLVNDAPAPFPSGGDLRLPHLEVMQFRVVRACAGDPFFLPDALSSVVPLDPATARATRAISLVENPPGSGMLKLNGKGFRDGVDETPEVDTVEVWEFDNTTDDAHPMHLHLVQFQVLERLKPDGTPGSPVDDNERGWKDTVRTNPQEVTRIIARFEGYTGQYVYHCHILEHEDHDMMRAYVVVPPGMPVMGGHGHGGVGTLG